jgi:aquaporin Z
MDYQALLAEFFGTFLLVLAVLASGGNALVVGGVLALVIALIGGLSGGHVNPAVSTAMYFKGSLSMTEYLSYVAVQMIAGATCLYTYKAFA